MKIMFLLCRNGKYDEAAEGIGELIQYYDRYEPKSHFLYYEAGKLFSRMVSPLLKSKSLRISNFRFWTVISDNFLIPPYQNKISQQLYTSIIAYVEMAICSIKVVNYSLIL